MKQKTKVALNAFACGSIYSSMVSSIMRGQHWTVSVLILLAVLFSTIIFVKAYSDE